MYVCMYVYDIVYLYFIYNAACTSLMWYYWCKIFAYVIAVVDVVITAIKYKTYIHGEPNKPVDLTGKVYIVTGCNTGIG